MNKQLIASFDETKKKCVHCKKYFVYSDAFPLNLFCSKECLDYYFSIAQMKKSVIETFTKMD